MSTSSSSTTDTFKRIITTHPENDTDGSLVSLIADDVPLRQVLSDEKGSASICVLYSHLGLPSINPHTLTSSDISASQSAVQGVVRPGGINCQVTELSPGFKVDYHRTSSVDYNIFLEGSAWLITPTADGKEERTEVKAGEVVIQTGTLHAWEAGKDGAKWCSVLVAAKPVEVGGKTLDDVDF